jgi:hypothetical protein
MGDFSQPQREQRIEDYRHRGHREKSVSGEQESRVQDNGGTRKTAFIAVKRHKRQQKN